MEGYEPLLTTQEVAVLFRVDEKTVRRWADAGKLTAIRTPSGARLLFRTSEVHMLLDAREGNRDG